MVGTSLASISIPYTFHIHSMQKLMLHSLRLQLMQGLILLVNGLTGSSGSQVTWIHLVTRCHSALQLRSTEVNWLRCNSLMNAINQGLQVWLVFLINCLRAPTTKSNLNQFDAICTVPLCSHGLPLVYVGISSTCNGLKPAAMPLQSESFQRGHLLRETQNVQ